MIPVIVPAYDQAEQQVIVKPMHDFYLTGISPQTPLTRKTKNVAIIYFDNNAYKLNDQQKKYLNLINQSHYKIIGFASAIGGIKLNQTLSFKRANVVAEYLKSQGSIICTIVGKGIIDIQPPYKAQKVMVQSSQC